MADTGAEKLKVFISYSRRDSVDFADELVVGLEDRGFAPFLDRHDIAAGEQWEARLGGLIDQADTTVFVVSPEAVKSERCAWEVDRTLALSKRLLPVLYKPVPNAEIPANLSQLQFVRFDTGIGVMRPLRELVNALQIDLDSIREHTRLGEIAARWEKRGRPETLLLRGDELDAAKLWMAARKAAAPEITEAQRTFISTSEDAENARLGKERAQLEEMAHAQAVRGQLQRRAGRLLGGVAALVVLLLGYVTWKDYDVARREVAVFTSLAANALKEEQFDRAMRYALQAYPARGYLPWLTPFSIELEGKLAGGAQSTQLHRVLKGHSQRGIQPRRQARGDGVRDHGAAVGRRKRQRDRGVRGHTELVQNALFSPDGKRVVTASYDSTARLWEVDSGKEIAVSRGHTRRGVERGLQP